MKKNNVPNIRLRLLWGAAALGVVLGQAGYWATAKAAAEPIVATAANGGDTEDAAQALRWGDAALTVMVTTQAELQRALDTAANGTVVSVSRDITLTKPLEVKKTNTAVRLCASSGSVTLYAPSSRHFTCGGSNLDLLFEGIVLDGKGSGGGVHSTATGLSLGGAVIQNCLAGSGGGVEAAAGSLYLEEGLVIRGNRATAYGGGVFTGAGVTLQVDGGEIRGNTAGAYGGGVFGGVASKVRMDGGRICENQAVLGAGLYAGLSNTVHLAGGEISGNLAAGGGSDGGKGGGVYAVTCDISIDGAAVTDNRATHGGGVYATGDGSDVVLHSGSIHGNESAGADACGGGVYLDTAYSTANTFTLNGGRLSGNQGVRGGGVYAAGNVPGHGTSNPGSSISAVITVNGGDIHQNSAGLGGGMYAATGCKVTLEEGTVRENVAQDGGAVWIEPLSNLTAREPVRFEDNRADSHPDTPSEEHIALHGQKIKATVFSGGHSYGYNNLDIVYDTSNVEQQSHTVRFEYEGGRPTGGGEQELERKVKHGAALGALPNVEREGYTLTGWYTAKEGGKLVTASTGVNESLRLYARWKANSYTLHFSYGDAQRPQGAVTQKEVTFGSPIGYLPIPTTDTDKAFVGWFDETTGVHYFPATIYRVAGAVTLTARVAPVEVTRYTVTFDYDGGDGDDLEPERTVTDGEPIGELPLPAKEGWVFGGWFGKVDNSGPWTAMDAVVKDIDLQAKWTPPPHEIRFHYMGAEEAANDQEQERYITRGESVGELPAPPLPDLTWRGWYADQDLTQPVDSGTIPQGDMDLYALWQGQLLFDYQDADATPELPGSKQVAYGVRIGALPIPNKTGHSFSGWHGEPDGAGRYYGGGVSGKTFDSREDTVLYASFQADQYTLHFDYQGGESHGSPSSKAVTYGDNVGALPFPEKEGMRFGGWFTQPEGKGTQYFVGTTYEHTGNMTLYAAFVSDTAGEAAAAAEGSRPSATRSGVAGASEGPLLVEIPEHKNPMTGR